MMGVYLYFSLVINEVKSISATGKEKWNFCLKTGKKEQ